MAPRECPGADPRLLPMTVNPADDLVLVDARHVDAFRRVVRPNLPGLFDAENGHRGLEGLLHVMCRRTDQRREPLGP